jgi:hypothetical protein
MKGWTRSENAIYQARRWAAVSQALYVSMIKASRAGLTEATCFLAREHALAETRYCGAMAAERDYAGDAPTAARYRVQARKWASPAEGQGGR